MQLLFAFPHVGLAATKFPGEVLDAVVALGDFALAAFQFVAAFGERLLATVEVRLMRCQTVALLDVRRFTFVDRRT